MKRRRGDGARPDDEALGCLLWLFLLVLAGMGFSLLQAATGLGGAPPGFAP